MKIRGARCLVLGAGGFMGTNLCLGLLAAGAQVQGFGRRPHDPEVLADLDWAEGDFEEAPRIVDAVRDKHFVFHLLGGSTPSLSNANPPADIAQSLLPSVRLMEACRRAGTGRLIFASSGGTVYGTASPDPLKESSPTDPITGYGINKLAVEKYLGLYRNLHGLDSVVLRISNPYGPYQHARRSQGVVGVMLANALAGQPIDIWNDGSIVRDFIHIDDVVSAMIAAAEHDGEGRLFNVGSGVGRSLREVLDAICAVTGLDRSLVRYSSGRPEDVRINILDIELIEREMRWRPRVEWMEGLRATVDWMRSGAGADRASHASARPVAAGSRPAAL